MKKNFWSLLMFFALAVTVISCGGGKNKVQSTDEGKVISGEGTTLTVDTLQSTLTWAGFKLVGGGHNGVVAIKSGEIVINGEEIVSGNLVVDLSTIEDKDLEGEMKGKLEGHLKSADFFDVENFPEAIFEITSAVKGDDGYKISGNLKIKDQTREITLDAKISKDGDNYIAHVPAFTINRAEWGIEYGSDKIVDLAKDKIIKNDIEFTAHIVAK